MYMPSATSFYSSCLGSLLDTTHIVGYAQAVWFYGVTNYLMPLVLLDTLHWYVDISYDWQRHPIG